MPSCPAYYTCTFVPQQAHTIVRHVGPWWQKTGAAWIVILAILSLLAMLITAVYYYHQRKEARQAAQERERERQAKFAIEEQRTMQIDACKGNPDMLKIVQGLQRGY